MIGCHYGTVNASGRNGLDLCKIAEYQIEPPCQRPLGSMSAACWHQPRLPRARISGCQCQPKRGELFFAEEPLCIEDDGTLSLLQWTQP